ncbi:MAG: hypothetical protein ACRDZM_14620, partial [Acidimicrobiia bacterium]
MNEPVHPDVVDVAPLPGDETWVFQPPQRAPDHRSIPARSSRNRHSTAASRSPSPAALDCSYTATAVSRRGVGAPTERAKSRISFE